MNSVRATISHILNWVFSYCTVPYTAEILSEVIKMKSTLKVWKIFNEEINNYLVLIKAGCCNLVGIMDAQECTSQAEEFLVSICFLLQMTEGEVLKKLE